MWEESERPQSEATPQGRAGWQCHAARSFRTSGTCEASSHKNFKIRVQERENLDTEVSVPSETQRRNQEPSQIRSTSKALLLLQPTSQIPWKWQLDHGTWWETPSQQVRVARTGLAQQHPQQGGCSCQPRVA